MGFSGNGYSTASTVITTQGDLRIGNSVGAAERLAIGSSGKLLKSDGSTASWETLTTADSTLTTQGDVLYEGASGLARLGQSTDGHVLTTKGASANPEWAAVSAGATTSIVEAVLTADFSTTSTTVVDVTSATLTKPNISGGVCFSAWFCSTYNSNAGTCTQFGLDDNGTIVSIVQNQPTAGSYNSNCISLVDGSSSDGNTLKVVMRVSAGTGHAYWLEDDDACDAIPKLTCMGVG